LYESGELEKRIKEAEYRGDNLKRGDGVDWRIRVRVASMNDYSPFGEGGSRGGGKERVEEKDRNEETPDRRNSSSKYSHPSSTVSGNKFAPPLTLQQQRQHQERLFNFYRLSFFGFSSEFGTAQIERTLRTFLPWWKDLVVTPRGSEVIVRIIVAGETICDAAEREGGKLIFGGRKVRVTRTLIERARGSAEGRRGSGDNEDEQRVTRRRREESIDQLRRKEEKSLKRLSETRDDGEATRLSKRRRRRVSSNEGDDEDPERTRRRSRSVTSKRYSEVEGGGYRKHRLGNSQYDVSDGEDSRSLAGGRRRTNDDHRRRSDTPPLRSSSQRHSSNHTQPHKHSQTGSTEREERWDSGGWNELEKERKEQFAKWEYNGNGGMRSWPRELRQSR